MGAYLLPRLGTMQSGELVAELLTQRDELQDFIADLIAERLNETLVSATPLGLWTVMWGMEVYTDEEADAS